MICTRWALLEPVVIKYPIDDPYITPDKYQKYCHHMVTKVMKFCFDNMPEPPMLQNMARSYHYFQNMKYKLFG